MIPDEYQSFPSSIIHDIFPDHLSMTREDKIWPCPVCPQTSRRKWNIEVHIKRKHQYGSVRSQQEHRGQQYQNGVYNIGTVLPSVH